MSDIDNVLLEGFKAMVTIKKRVRVRGWKTKTNWERMCTLEILIF